MNCRHCARQIAILAIFAAVFISLSAGSYRRESATVDEPQHLTTGYVMLKLHDFRLDPEHPPLLRMWAALPLLAMSDINLPTNNIAWHNGDEWTFARAFLFQTNDVNRLLFPARFMITLLGVLLGILLFAWARELFGLLPATIVLLLFCLEPNIMAHSGLVTTDVGATAFIFGAVYFAWRLARRFNTGNLIGLTLFFVAAQLSKYSAVLLIPLIFAILLFRTAPGRLPKFMIAGLVMLGLMVVTYSALWGIYDFRYAPTPDSIEKVHLDVLDKDTSDLPRLAQLVRWADEHKLLPNACTQGFLSMAAKSRERPGYLMGEHSDRGWWYYFPIAFLIKTPIALLGMAFIGLLFCVLQWPSRMADAGAIIGSIVVFFGAAVFSNLNIGLRHILPIYPFILLLAGWTVASFWGSSQSWQRFVVVGLCLIQLVEFGAIYPNCLAFFNVSVGGPDHGSEYLVDSNLDWGQGLIQLKEWMVAHQVQHINLSYFGTADPASYGIDYASLSGSYNFVNPRAPSEGRVGFAPFPPQQPLGYVAVSATYLRGAYLSQRRPNLYAPLLDRKPVAVIAHCIYVYRIDQNWW